MKENLMERFPLSRSKKLKKKVLEKVIPFIILSLFISLPAFFVYQAFFGSAAIDVGIQILLAVILGLFVFVAMTVGYGFYVSYYIKTYYYADDGDFLTIKKGVFTPSEIHVQYLKIQDVYVDQDILDRIMGLYDVHISSATYTSGIEAHIDGVEKEHAESLKNFLLGKIKHSSSPRAAETNTHHSEPSVHVSANFSSPISSKVYGLNKDWWLSEIVKLAIGSVITPLIIGLWVYLSITDGEAATSMHWLITSAIWLVALVIFVIYRTTYLYLWKRHYSYEFGEEYIHMKQGVLSISEKNMGYNSIQDVKIHQTLIDRIFGVADLIIENASQGVAVQYGKTTKIVSNGITIEGLSLADAQKISNEVKKVIINKGNLTKGL